MGGLGNQLFQYAAGKALAVKHKVPLKLDLSFLKAGSDSHTRRHLALDIFNLEYEICSPADLKLINRNAFTKRVSGLFPFLFKPVFHAREKGFAYDPDFFSFPKNTYLDGFWQSEKYFETIRTLLLETVRLKEEPAEIFSNTVSRMQETNSVSIHVRRGDYVTNKNANSFHGTLPLDYYRKAMEYLNASENKLEYFIFSDDLDWVKEHLKIEGPKHYIDFNDPSRSAYDLQLMSLCKHNIIANSSFSWWGAWLNQNSGKKVIAPKNWFQDKKINTKDLLPGAWIKL